MLSRVDFHKHYSIYKRCIAVYQGNQKLSFLGDRKERQNRTSQNVRIKKFLKICISVLLADLAQAATVELNMGGQSSHTGLLLGVSIEEFVLRFSWMIGVFVLISINGCLRNTAAIIVRDPMSVVTRDRIWNSIKVRSTKNLEDNEVTNILSRDASGFLKEDCAKSS